MVHFISKRYLNKSEPKLQKAWERKSETQEYREPKYTYKEKRKVKLLEVIPCGPHRLQLVTRNSCQMYINTPGFKKRIEPEGKMSVNRSDTPVGASYRIDFAGPEEWEYIKSVFMAFAFMAGKWN